MKYLISLQRIMCMNKEELLILVDKGRKGGTQLAVSNWFNLALACKSK
jgi:hypothetical protein